MKFREIRKHPTNGKESVILPSIPREPQEQMEFTSTTWKSQTEDGIGTSSLIMLKMIFRPNATPKDSASSTTTSSTMAGFQ